MITFCQKTPTHEAAAVLHARSTSSLRSILLSHPLSPPSPLSSLFSPSFLLISLVVSLLLAPSFPLFFSFTLSLLSTSHLSFSFFSISLSASSDPPSFLTSFLPFPPCPSLTSPPHSPPARLNSGLVFPRVYLSLHPSIPGCCRVPAACIISGCRSEGNPAPLPCRRRSPACPFMVRGYPPSQPDAAHVWAATKLAAGGIPRAGADQ